MFVGDPLSNHVRGRVIEPAASSDASFRTIAKWLKECLDSHPNCSRSLDSILPTRVINVSAATPFLQLTRGERGPWVTLSHCWGSQTPLTTTTETLQLRSQGIAPENLPATFRDAIQITRQLGFKYIWIDSLCILQDSRADWLVESSAMREIYRNAY